MISDKELRDAVDYFCSNKVCQHDWLKPVFSLVEQYLTISTQEGMPEEMPTNTDFPPVNEATKLANTTRQECLLAFMKMVPSVEEIRRVIINRESPPIVYEDDIQAEVVDGSKKLAQTIHDLFTRKIEGKV